MTRRGLAESQRAQWGKLHEAVEPFYPKVEARGLGIDWPRSHGGHARGQQCFGLSDEGVEDEIYSSQSIHAFVSVDLGGELAPAAMSLLEFRHFFEAKCSRARSSPRQGIACREGHDERVSNIADITLIAAPPSTKNRTASGSVGAPVEERE